jgi:hypothetical protein
MRSLAHPGKNRCKVFHGLKLSCRIPGFYVKVAHYFICKTVGIAVVGMNGYVCWFRSYPHAIGSSKEMWAAVPTKPTVIVAYAV